MTPGDLHSRPDELWLNCVTVAATLSLTPTTVTQSPYRDCNCECGGGVDWSTSVGADCGTNNQNPWTFHARRPRTTDGLKSPVARCMREWTGRLRPRALEGHCAPNSGTPPFSENLSTRNAASPLPAAPRSRNTHPQPPENGKSAAVATRNASPSPLNLVVSARRPAPRAIPPPAAFILRQAARRDVRARALTTPTGSSSGQPCR